MIVPTYQVGVFTHEEGWRIWSSKQVIRWTFGFANASALAYGLRGRHCRGEEYVIVLDWTKSRRQVWVNNILIHESIPNTISGGRGEFVYSFDLPTKFDNQSHIVQIKARGVRDILAELFVDGEAFSEMIHTYELATSTNTIQFPIDNGLSMSSRLEEEMVKLAKARSRKEMPPRTSWTATCTRLFRRVPLRAWLVMGGILVLKAEESGYLVSLAEWIRFSVQCALLFCSIAAVQDRWPRWLQTVVGEAVLIPLDDDSFDPSVLSAIWRQESNLQSS